jgi:hypothetical protein
MTLIEVKEYLYSNLVDKTLTITYAEENVFKGLVFALSKHSFTVENCTINPRPENIPNEIIVTGISKLTDNSNSVINGRHKIQINITADKNNNAVYIFAAAVDGIYTMSEYFGSLAPQYMRGYSDGDTEKKNAYLTFLPGVMGGFKLTNPVILYNSAEKNDYFNLPLNFSAGFLFGALPPGSLWADDFSAILDNFNTTVTGALSLRPMYENYIPFIIKIALGDKSMFPGLPLSHKLYAADGGIFPSKAGLALIFQHALTFNDFDTLSCPTSAGAYLQLGFKFDSIETPFNFTTPIFRTEDFWTLNVTFPDGLGIIDIINFFSSLFGVSGKSGLLLPADLNINIMKLYQMNFGMSRNGNNLGLKEVYAVLGMSRYWELFSGLTLNNLGMYWHIQWGKTSHLLTGGIGAELQIALTSSKILTLKAGAAIPNLDIYASLELTDAEKTAKKYQ